MNPEISSPDVMPKQVMGHDFVGGLLHQLALRSGGKFAFNTNDRRLDAAFKEAFDYLADRADAAGLELDFGIFPDQIHGDSITLREELIWLSTFPMLRGYNGSYVELVYDATDSSAQIFEQSKYLPLELAEELADVFLKSY
jgi:hypothetical protein